MMKTIQKEGKEETIFPECIMERVDNNDHPLSSPTRFLNHHHRRCRRSQPMDDSEQEQVFSPPQGSSCNSSNNNINNHHLENYVTRSPAASLIQSVARSALLDEATPNSTVTSDDVSEVMSGQHYATNRNSLTPATTGANLSSLQTPTLPALPDEQDRRRFIGCLAAVLASSYDYDVAAETEDEDSTTTANNNINNTTSSTAVNESVWLSYPDDFWENDDLDNSNDQMVDDANNFPKASPLSKTRSTASDSFFYNTRCQSFESLGTQESSKTNVSGKMPPSARSNRRRRQTVDSLHRKSSIFSNNSKEKERRSQERHRHRRYELLSKLLMSSSELLLLDKTVARAFLPMLSRVLVPECRQWQKNINGDSIDTPSRKPPFVTTSWSLPSSPNNPTTESRISNASSDKVQVQSARKSSKISLSHGTTESFIAQTQQLLSPSPMDNEEELKPFLESLTPGAGFRCVALFLLQHLLTSETGYDARVRHVVKKLSVIVLIHEMQLDPVERYYEQQNNGTYNRPTQQDMMLRATRKFEALEHSLAQRLLRLSNLKSSTAGAMKASSDAKRREASTDPTKNSFSREQLVRTVKIGGAGIVAGTLFALTGGLAAPGIAAGVAAVAGAAAGTAAVAALTSAPVVTTIFGVGGGGLAAYKMQRRTQGVTEFEFYNETGCKSQTLPGNNKAKPRWGRDPTLHSENGYGEIEAELFTVLCISGWLRDRCDYQRPWGVQPTRPRIQDRQELLERFYFVHSPEHLPKIPKILESWKGEEGQLWKVLRDKYGCDPDNLYPLSDGPRIEGALTLEQEEILEKLFIELGYNSVAPEREAVREQQSPYYSPFQRMTNGWNNRNFQPSTGPLPHQPTETCHRDNDTLDLFSINDGTSTDKSDFSHQEKKLYKRPKHLDTVWDWKSTYGGEMYHVKWESELLKRICDCFIDLAMDVVSGATKQILKQTVFHTLLAAVVWPSYLLSAADLIDGDWTLAVERADEAGKVLAKTLLFSRAGQRPVTLVGYSFGGRIIYSCLKELARYQEEWENFQDMVEEKNNGGKFDSVKLAKYEAKMKGMREPAGIVEDAILMGLPNHLSLQSWRACRQIVSGRLVNCYSRRDLILSLMFQAKRFCGGSLNAGMGSFLKPVCGTCAVDVPGVENVDCSDLILGHQDYCMEVGKLLERIRFGQPMRCQSSRLISSVSGLPAEEEISDDMVETTKTLTF
jgi:hypothetical protein